jgi:hypothetical protein
MNIFVLDYDPVNAAKMQCDKHVVKMPLESAQLLCSVYSKGKAPYKRTHYNHPCSIWTRKSKNNFLWLVEHGIALCDEYTFRYGKIHKSKQVINWCKKNINVIEFESIKKTKFALCFDEKYHVGIAVKSYREYYRYGKNKIA